MATSSDTLWVTDNLSAGLKVVYDNRKPTEQYKMFRGVAKYLLPADKTNFIGDEYEVTLEHKPLATARGASYADSAFHAPRKYGLDKYTVRQSTSAGGNNDMRRIDGAISVSDLDLFNAKNASGKGAAWKADLVMRYVKQVDRDFGHYLSAHMNMGTDAVLAKINGSPKQNDNRVYASASAIGSASHARVKLFGNERLAYFTEGMLVDVIDSANGVVRTNCSELEITGTNAVDGSIGLVGTADLSAISDGDYIVLSGNYNQNVHSLHEWFSDSTIYGLDRTQQAYYYMVPHIINEGASDATLTNSKIEDLAVAMADVIPDQNGYVLSGTKRHLRALMATFDPANVFRYGPGDKNDFVSKYGFTGQVVYTPEFGNLHLEADPMAPYDSVKFFNPKYFKMLWNYGNTSIRWVPNDAGGMWHRKTSGGRPTLEMEAFWFVLCATICYAPRLNALIDNVTG